MKFITKIKIGLLTSAYWLMVNANIVFAQAGFVSCKGGLIKTADGYKLGCNLCDLLILVKNVITFMIELSVAFAGLFFAWGAFNMMIAGGSQEKFSKGKEIMTIAVTGAVITLAAWLIIGTVLQIVTDSPSKRPWTTIQCNF